MRRRSSMCCINRREAMDRPSKKIRTNGPYRRSTGEGASCENWSESSSQHIVVSVVENRAREVCICKINTALRHIIEVFNVTDSYSYNETMMLIKELAPNEILLTDNAKKKILSKKIEIAAMDAQILYVNRQYFDQDRGEELLHRLHAGPIDSDIYTKYTILSACHCLIRFVENESGQNFPSHSVRIVVDSNRDIAEKLYIDRKSARSLELVTNSISGDQSCSLFGTINYCKTSVGMRLLRSNILQPLKNISSILERQEFVDLLLKNNRSFADIAQCLGQFPDLDKMLSGLCYEPKSITANTVRTGIDALIFVKNAMTNSQHVAAVLGRLANSESPNSTQPLLNLLTESLENQQLKGLISELANTLEEKSTFKRITQEMRYEECFAIRSGVNGLLDIARKTFLQSVSEMEELVEIYSNREGFPVRMQFNNTRGFFISVPNELLSLPPYFVQAVQNKKSIYCSTLEMISTSDRAMESINQALSITNDIIQTCLSQVRSHIDQLFNMTDAVALVDMLASFADLVALSTDKFVKPDIIENGSLVIRGGRHQIVDSLPIQQISGPFVPNDLELSHLKRFQIITGPNASGKTVYIKQVALIVVLAQIGCFVPAEYAAITPRDRILTRLGNDDDFEHNMSTFSVEMKEAANIIETCTADSLVLIDELGRGSSNLDGLSLAVAISEKLLCKRPLVLFTTHYQQLCSLEALYATIKNVHFQTRIHNDPQDDVSASSRITFVHKTAPGACGVQAAYGISLSEMCGFPGDVVNKARAVRVIVAERCAMHFTTAMDCALTNPLDSTSLARIESLLDSQLSSEDIVRQLCHVLT